MKRTALAGLAIVAAAAAGVFFYCNHRGGHHEGGGSDAGSATATDGDHHRGRGHRDGAAGGGGGGDVVLVDDDPKGTLRLEGQVLGEGDKPVAGAIVMLSSNPPRTAKSEDDGSFAFDALVARPYVLTARALAGVAGPVTAKLSQKTDPVILHLRPAGSLIVTVVDPKQKPIGGATVELRGIDSQEAETEASGAATFAQVVPGGYEVVASAPGYAHARTPVRIAEGKIEVKLQVARGARVAGKVVDDAGAPVAGARVVYGGASDWSARGDERLDGVTTDDAGRFAFDALPGGTWRFAAHHPEHAPGTSALVTLDGATAREDVLIKMPVGALVRGKVVDDTGAPVATARVRVGGARNTMVGEGPRQVYADDRGEFVVKGLPRAPLLAIAMSEDAASDSVKVDTSNGDVTDVVLKLDVTGTIAGTVVDEAGNPLEGVQVSAFPDFGAAAGGGGRRGGGGGEMAQWRLRGFPQELTDGTGHFALTGLEQGTYRVSATRSQHASRGRGMTREGTPAETGTKDLRIVLPPEGSVKGKVQYSDGTPPGPFVVTVGGMQQPVASADGSFLIDGLTPDHYTVSVRGNGFVPKSAEVDVKGGQTVDAGTLSVEKGRTIGGRVVAGGQPVAGATVYAGNQIFGNGSTSDAKLGAAGPAMAQNTRTTTTGDDGSFSLSGFGQADITLVAEDTDLGRSVPVRLIIGDPSEDNLTLEILPYGALHGVLHTGNAPAPNVIVTAQSATSAGALYSVASGPDGAYRFDKLAPDTYKVSAMVGMPMRGMKFYSQSATVPSNQDIGLDLQYDPGAVTLDVTGAPANGAKTSFALFFIASGTITAKINRDLQQQLAAQGQGTSQMNFVPMGKATQFTELDPGPYTACAVALPAEVGFRGGREYFEKYGDTLPASCAPVTVQASPTEQSMTLPIIVPPYQGGPSGQGSGSGSGTGSGSGGGSGSGRGSGA